MTISDLKLEQLALGELSEADAASLRLRIQGDADAAGRLAEIKVSNVALLEAYPPVGVRAEVERRVHVIDLRETKSRVGLASMPFTLQRLIQSLRWVAVAACVVGAMTFLVPEVQEEPDFRLKGGAAELVVHRVVGEVADRLEQGAGVKAGDRLQVSILGGAGEHVVVVSIDGRGEVTLHHPLGGVSARVSEPAYSLPSSYQLDDAPSYERFFMVTSKETLSPEDVVQAAKDLVKRGGAERGDLEELPVGTTSKALTLVKGNP